MPINTAWKNTKIILLNLHANVLRVICQKDVQGYRTVTLEDFDGQHSIEVRFYI